MLFEQPHRVAGLEVLREDEDANFGMRFPDAVSRDKPLVGVRRRHSYIDECHVWPSEPHSTNELFGICRLADYVEPSIRQQPCEPFAHQHCVVGNDYTHGNSAWTAVRVLSRLMTSVPFSAPTRS